MKRQKTIQDIKEWLVILDEIESYYMIFGERTDSVRRVIDSGERLLSILTSQKSKDITEIEEPFIEVFNKWRYDEVIHYDSVKIAKWVVKSLFK